MLPSETRHKGPKHGEDEILGIALVIIWLTLAATITVMTAHYVKFPWNLYAILWLALGLVSALMRDA